jgi:transcriptional regulator with XRE-family HTH domain
LNPRGKRKRPRERYLFNGKKLRSFRERAQLTLTQVAEKTWIATSSISDYECEKIVPQLHQFKKLSELYKLDPFEICEVLWLQIFDAKVIWDFHKACKRCDATPKEEINTFMKVYAYNIFHEQNLTWGEMVRK